MFLENTYRLLSRCLITYWCRICMHVDVDLCRRCESRCPSLSALVLWSRFSVSLPLHTHIREGTPNKTVTNMPIRPSGRTRGAAVLSAAVSIQRPLSLLKCIFCLLWLLHDLYNKNAHTHTQVQNDGGMKEVWRRFEEQEGCYGNSPARMFFCALLLRCECFDLRHGTLCVCVCAL